MLPLIYTDAWAAGIFIIACLIWSVPEIIGAMKQTAKAARKEATVQDRASMWILIGLQAVGLALNFLLAGRFQSAAIAWHRTAIFGAGVVLILLGVAFRWYAIGTLGSYFTRDVAVSPEQKIVQTGPYRYIRHPAYSGTFLTMLGVGVATTNWAGLIALLAGVLLGHLYRVGVEEKALARTIGEPYLEYMHRTKRFIPLVW